MGSTAGRIIDIGPPLHAFDLERASKENPGCGSIAWSGR